MPNKGVFWSKQEEEILIKAYKSRPPGMNNVEFAKAIGTNLNKNINSIIGRLNRFVRDGTFTKQIITPSPYPVYDTPLELDGDALILPDMEIPFHNSEFVNRVLEMAQKWNIHQCILAGDVLHFDSLSGWEPNWVPENSGGLTASAEEKLMDYAMSLPAKKQGELMELIGNIGQRNEQDGVSTELNVARRELKKMAGLFDKIDFLLGNHEGRLLRALQTAVNPSELLRLLDADEPKWRIATYYYSYLNTCNGRYQVEHPKGAAEGTAQRLAEKYHAHIVMGHSHLLDFTWDISGKFYAIHAGHCVDELRLPYAAQRHTTKRAHKPGAVIVRDGYPWLFHEGVDWEKLAKL